MPKTTLSNNFHLVTTEVTQLFHHMFYFFITVYHRALSLGVVSVSIPRRVFCSQLSLLIYVHIIAVLSR